MLFSLFLCILLRTSVSYNMSICTQITSCSCMTSSNEIIDLSPLALSGGDPLFKDVPDSSGSYYYSWNPCTPFTEDPTSCADVMGCQTDMMNYFSLGTPESAQFINGTQSLILQYSATTDATRTLEVKLVCDESTEASLTVAGENPPGSATYEMTLTSKYCCPREPTTTISPQPTTSSPQPTTSTPQQTTRSPQPTTINPCPPDPFSYDTIILIQIAILIAILLLMFLSCIVIYLLVSKKSTQSTNSYEILK